jgi:hypothetical protein
MLPHTYLLLLPLLLRCLPPVQLDQELRSLSSYLPQPLVEVYRGMGMTRDLYAWQVCCCVSIDE